MAAQTPAQQLYDILVTKNFEPEMLDTNGKPATNPADTDIFSFDWTAESENDYGTVVIMLADDNDLQMYYGDNIARGMEIDDKNDWFAFLGQIKDFSTKNMLSFSPKNLNQLKYAMQSMAAVRESIFESWTGTKTASWNGKATEARLMIRHSKSIAEGDKRFRYVESLFIETAEGERYKLPFTKLSGGRAMLEHVRTGGRVYDPRGQHIAEMVTELNVLSRFRRSNHGKIFEGDTAQLVEQTNMYYENLHRELKSIGTNRGYTQYFESWKPMEVTEQDVVIEGIKHLFVTQSLDTRVEQALPVLARIQQQGIAMKEAQIFEAWVNNLSEGTWATPDTPEKKQQLITLMSKEFPVGADATNATEQLYNLIGDDELFDQLEALASEDPDADCRQVVMDRMDMLSDDPDVQEVIAQLQVEPEATMNPAPQVDPEDLDEGSMKRQMEADAERMSREKFCDLYGDEHGEFWDNINLDESIKDPSTQTEDPAGTAQPAYPEYADDLESILKIAGVPAEETEAVDYEPEIKEGDSSPLQGPYGHSGKMKPVEKDSSFLDRIKELSGMMRSDKI
jgi:hypothetical protein